MLTLKHADLSRITYGTIFQKIALNNLINNQSDPD